ncbi:hypothetical protein BH10ACT3_BH10ACT3_22650 [soil metagenome]
MTPADRDASVSTNRDSEVIKAANILNGRRESAIRVDEGLRERKKRVLRQLISDTATVMFIERGFDAGRVSEIAEACDVSEKTFFNYFPTKESLLFDEEDGLADRIREALRDRGTQVPLIDSVVAVIEDLVNKMTSAWSESDQPEATMSVMRRFADMIEETPALQAALQAMFERLTVVAADALAERAAVDPDDPEPQLAAVIVMGLWRVFFGSMRRYSADDLSVLEMRDAVLADIHRAARVADSGLSSFNLVVHEKDSRQQLREAADATKEARDQVVAAVKQAREAWRQVVAEVQAHQQEHHQGDTSRAGKAEEKRRRQEMVRQLRQEHRERQSRQRGGPPRGRPPGRAR